MCVPVRERKQGGGVGGKEREGRERERVRGEEKRGGIQCKNLILYVITCNMPVVHSCG